MKVLFVPLINKTRLTPNHMTMADAVQDSIFHGLRSILGENVVDSQHLWHLYKSGRSHPDFGQLYGRGFTMCGNLDDIKIDRDDLGSKVRNKFFDLIIVCSHCTTAPNSWHISPNHMYGEGETYNIVSELSKYYNKNRLFFIDTLDQSSVKYESIRNYVTYFKREGTTGDTEDIGISIPPEKIQSYAPKTDDFADLIPYHINTYKYNQEQPYYDMYNRAFFSYCEKKGGIDSTRTGEIVACRSIPFFIGIENTPQKTMAFHPKHLYKQAMELTGVNHDYSVRMDEVGKFKKGFLDERFDKQKYEDLNNQIFDHFTKYLTTHAMALYLLSKAI